MAAISAVADLDALLKPIADDHPAGRDLRYGVLDTKKGTYWYDVLREAHQEDIFRQTPKLPDWPAVIDLSTQALTAHTKDLQIATWLANALAKYDQYDRLIGLRDSLKLTRGLIEQYWDQLYPAADFESNDGRFTERANIIAALEASLAAALKSIPLTESQTGLRYSYFNWEDAKKFDVPDKDKFDSLSTGEQEQISALKEQAAKEKKITSEDWRKAVNTTPYEFFKDRLDLLAACAAEVAALDEVMDTYFQNEAPGLRALRQSLEDVQMLASILERDKRPPDAVITDLSKQPEGTATNGGATSSGLAPLSGTVQTRQEALRRLAEVAEYFRQAEPHSPVYYQVQRAIRWGNMDLASLLAEVVKDQTALGQYYEILGVEQVEPKTEGD